MKILLTAMLLIINSVAFSQIKWIFDPVIMERNQIDLCIYGDLEPGWHIFSSAKEDLANNIPTTIKIYPNKDYTLLGPMKETGRIVRHYDSLMGVNFWWYEGEVTFVHSFYLKRKKEVVIRGSITYQLCTKDKCLMPITKEFETKIPPGFRGYK